MTRARTLYSGDQYVNYPFNLAIPANCPAIRPRFAFLRECAHTQQTWLLRPVRRSASVDTDPLLSALDETDPF